MAELHATNWTGDWLNAWLAAIGATVLVEGLQLRWSDDPLPHAVFSLDVEDVAGAIAAALPTAEEIEGLAIARRHPDCATDLVRSVTSETFIERAHLARSLGDLSLSATVTDLALTPSKDLPHSPFDPPVPKGLTLWERLVACRSAIDGDAAVRASLTGAVPRVRLNGLGFDYRRILSPADPIGDKWVDPVLETFAFAGLLTLPIRGDGVRETPRGWHDRASKSGAFRWLLWNQPLDVIAIDALLDRFWSAATPSGVRAYETVPYQALGQMDSTRGFGSRPVR